MVIKSWVILVGYIAWCLIIYFFGGIGRRSTKIGPPRPRPTPKPRPKNKRRKR